MEEFEALASMIRNCKIDLLLSHFEERQAVNYRESSTGNTLLHVACQNGNKRAIKCCLRQGADLNAQNNHGNTPMHFLIMYGYYELSEYVKTKGADDSILNRDGLTCYELQVGLT